MDATLTTAREATLRRQDTMRMKRRGSGREVVDRVFSNAGGLESSGRIDQGQYLTEVMYSHNRGEPHAAVRPIAERIASSPFHVAEVVKPSSKHFHSEHRDGRRRLSFEEMARMPKSTRKRLGLPTTDRVGEFVKAMKSVHSSAARIDILEEHPVLDVLTNPNPRFWGNTLMVDSVISLMFTGRLYWWLTNANGRPYDLWYLPAHRVEESPGNVRLDKPYLVHPPYHYGAEPIPIPAKWIIYAYLPDPADPMKALAPVQACMQNIRTGEAIVTCQEQTFNNGIYPGLLIKTGEIIGPDGKSMGKAQLERHQINELRARLHQEYKGPMKFNKDIIADRVIDDVQFLTRTPHEMAFMESYEANKKAVWSSIGTPPVIAGNTEDANRATALVADESFTQNVVNPMAALFSHVVNDQLLPLYNTSGDNLVMWLEESVSADRDQELKEVTLLASNRGMTVNELRSQFGKPPLPESKGDVLWAPATTIFEPLDDGDSYATRYREDLMEDQAQAGAAPKPGEGKPRKPRQNPPPSADDTATGKAAQRPIVRPQRGSDGLFVQPDDNSPERESAEQHNRERFANHFHYADPKSGNANTYDDKGDYNCGRCNMATGQKCLLIKNLKIDRDAGSCADWEVKNAGDSEIPLGEKTIETALYGVAANGMGFGCHRCPYASRAYKPDSQGRDLYCGKGDMRVFGNACCVLNGAETLPIDDKGNVTKHAINGIEKSVTKDRVTAWLKVHGRQEQPFQKTMEKFLRAQVKHIVSQIEKGGDPFNPREWDKGLIKAVQPHLQRCAIVGAQNIWQDRPPEKNVLVELPQRVLAAIRNFLASVIKQPYWRDINDTTAARLQTQLQESIEAGEAIHQTSKRVSDALGSQVPARALMIARSESTGGLNAGAKASIDELIEEGVATGYEWLATDDAHVRPTHWAANGQRSDDDGFFTVGGEQCRFPGDPALSAGNRCNCRCTLLSVLSDKSAVTPATKHFHKSLVTDSEILAHFPSDAEVFERLERRFLVDEPNTVLEQLRAHGTTRDYVVTSLYLDEHHPTWSVGSGGKKFRLRQYNSGATFLEEKFKINGITHKTRRQLQVEEVSEDLVGIGLVTYTRTEFEHDGHRITVDRNVDINGRQLGKIVVEVKGDLLPDWLQLPEGSESPWFSKSSTMLRYKVDNDVSL